MFGGRGLLKVYGMVFLITYVVFFSTHVWGGGGGGGGIPVQPCTTYCYKKACSDCSRVQFMCVVCCCVYIDVSVETIAGFNKMKSLTSDISMVVQVIKRSELIEVYKLPLLSVSIP